jgi:hypothetical protein
MNKAGRIFSAALVTYCLVWTMVYSIIMEGDFRYFSRYLQLSWTSPGEIPAMIQLVTLICTVTVSFITWFCLRKKQKNEQSNRTR